MRLSLKHTKQLLQEALCKSTTKAELVEVIGHAVDSLDDIQRHYVLLNRDMVQETK